MADILPPETLAVLQTIDNSPSVPEIDARMPFTNEQGELVSTVVTFGDKMEYYRTKLVITQEQHEKIKNYPQRSKKWHEARAAGVFTGSEIAKATGHCPYSLKACGTPEKVIRKYVLEKLWTELREEPPAKFVNYGREMEPVINFAGATWMDTKLKPHGAKRVFIHDRGLQVSVRHPWMGVSTDGEMHVVWDKNTRIAYGHRQEEYLATPDNYVVKYPPLPISGALLPVGEDEVDEIFHCEWKCPAGARSRVEGYHGVPISHYEQMTMAAALCRHPDGTRISETYLYGVLCDQKMEFRLFSFDQSYWDQMFEILVGVYFNEFLPRKILKDRGVLSEVGQMEVVLDL